MELKAIGAVSSAKVLGAFYSVIGLIAGVIVAVIGIGGDGPGQRVRQHEPVARAACSASSAIVLLPVLYGGLGCSGRAAFLVALQRHRPAGRRDSGDASVARDDHAFHADSTSAADGVPVATMMR